MTGQELKIIFIQDKGYLSKDRAMTFDQVKIFSGEAKVFKSPAFWTIKVINYRESEKELYCEVISYNSGKTEFSSAQLLLSNKLNEVQVVTFKSIDTTGLLITLAGKKPIQIRPSVYTPVSRPARQNSIEPPIIKPIKQIINETFSIPLKNVRFKLGGVSFDKKFSKLNRTIELTIVNYDIREEFDAVKNYFVNALKTKKIQVFAKIEVLDNEIISKEVKSPEIERIDKQLIDNVKFEYVMATKKKKINIEINKSLFTMDEYFDTFGEEKFKSNTFYQNNKELFEHLLSISNSKHYKNLRFLSSKHSHEIMKLRFVHTPFSFIFLIEGDRNYHIIWETLDTEEATYVWHIAKDLKILKMYLRKIEDIINVIKVQGKTAYLNSTEDQFRRIYHDYSDIVDGFVKWKGELESILT